MRRAIAWVVAVASIAFFVLPAVALPLILGIALPEGVPASGISIFYAPDLGARLASLVLSSAFGAFVVLGLVILQRWPRHRMGWLLLAIGATFALAFGAGAYGAYGRFVFAGLPAADLFLWSSSWSWIPGFTLLIVFVLLFPTGVPVSPRWRWVIWALIAVTGLQFASYFFGMDPSTAGLDVRRPFVIPEADDALYAIGRVGDLLQALIFVAGGYTLILRFRRGSEVEKQQVKLLGYSAGLLGTGIALTTVAALFGKTADVLDATTLPMTALFAAVPLSAGFAILRYRIFDVDVLINRTIVYGATVAIVGVTFISATLLLQTLLRPLTAGSDVAVAASTLATVALFQPIVRRVRGIVDARFYRSRYDAARTLDRFADRMRDEVDLDAVRSDLLVAIDETMRPRHAGVWLRDRA